MLKIYIASPYTLGDKEENVRRQLEVANDLIERGYYPRVPLYFHYQHLYKKQPESVWLKLGLELVSVSNCVMRLRGKSEGADGEVKFAKDNLKPVFFNDTVDELEANPEFIQFKNFINKNYLH